MTEAAVKVELRPETLLAHATDIAAADALSTRHCEVSRSSGGTAVPNAMHNSEGRDHRGIRFRPLNNGTQALEPLQGDRSCAGEGRRRGALCISGRLASARERALTYAARREA